MIGNRGSCSSDPSPTVSARAPVIVICAVIGFAAIARAEQADWPMARRDVQGRAFISLHTQEGERVKPWQFQAGSHVWGYKPGMSVWSSAALGRVNGRPVVVVGSYDHNLYCLDAMTGRKLWRFTTGGGIYAAPVLKSGPEGPRVFAASSDRMVYALDAGLGRRLWVHAVQTWRPTMGGARLSSPCVGRVKGGEAIFVGHWVWDKSLSGHMQAGGVTALDSRTGKELWTTHLGDHRVGSPIFFELDTKGQQGRLYVASENGNLYAIDGDSGKVIWTHTHRHAIMGTPALFLSPTGPRVLIGSKSGAVTCLDAGNGSRIWSFKTGHWVDGSPAVVRMGGRQVALVGSYDTKLYALDTTRGVALWSYQTAGGIYSSPAVALGDRRVRVLVSSWDHSLHCIAGEDGSLLWSAYLGRPLWDSISLGDSIWASAVVARINGQQVAYLGSYAGPFHAIPLDEAAQQALARAGSNLTFWFGLPVVLLAIGALTLALTRRYRRQKRWSSSALTR